MNLFIFPISEVSQKEPLRLNYTRTKNKFESTNKYNYMNLKEETNKKGKNNYTKFILMLAGSFIAMYITMYLNTYQIDHVYFSLTRLYMTCLGISAMALIMFFTMRKMYRNKKKNIAIVLGSIILFVSALGLVRVQKPIVGDVLWMKAMIPHHSIAILTSERADIKDPEVKQLANDIIEAQKREIEEMKTMISRLQKE